MSYLTQLLQLHHQRWVYGTPPIQPCRDFQSCKISAALQGHGHAVSTASCLAKARQHAIAARHAAEPTAGRVWADYPRRRALESAPLPDGELPQIFSSPWCSIELCMACCKQGLLTAEAIGISV